jgi:hypothetical protein
MWPKKDHQNGNRAGADFIAVIGKARGCHFFEAADQNISQCAAIGRSRERNARSRDMRKRITSVPPPKASALPQECGHPMSLLNCDNGCSFGIGQRDSMRRKLPSC